MCGRASGLRFRTELIQPRPAADRTLNRRFGFSRRRAVFAWKTSILGLEKLGFPWILSSESSNFNWLQDIFAENIFRVASPLMAHHGERPKEACAERRNCPYEKLNIIPDFLQSI
jgi:hypothetical protein